MASKLISAFDQPWIDAWWDAMGVDLQPWQEDFLKRINEVNDYINPDYKGQIMRSDLIGKVNLNELEPSTYYLHKKSGLVILTNHIEHPIYATVLHSPQGKYAVGTILQNINFTVERLGGKLILSN